MKDGIISKIIKWFKSPKSLDNEINRTADDIVFLNSKIRQSRQMFSDVIADKMTVQRNKLLYKQGKLLEKRRHLFK